MKRYSLLFLIFVTVFFVFVAPSLKAQTGILRVSFNTSGVSIFVDGALNRTNVSSDESVLLELSKGKHIVEFTKPGFANESRELIISADEVTKLKIEFKTVTDYLIKGTDTGIQIQGYGKLTVLSNPPGATILLDGQPVKGYPQTPDTFEKIPAGSVRVGVKLNGKEVEKTVTIIKGKTSKVSFDLTPKYGKLTVKADPVNSLIYVNGVYWDTAPTTQKLEVGDYNIRVESNGWLNEYSTVFVYEDQVTIVDALLKKPYPTETNISKRAEKKELLQLKDYLKEEYKIEYNNYGKYLAYGSGAAGVALSLIGAGSEPHNMGVAFLGVLLCGTAVWVSDLKSEKKIPIEDNISYNRNIRQEIEQRNKEFTTYNNDLDNMENIKKEKK